MTKEPKKAKRMGGSQPFPDGPRARWICPVLWLSASARYHIETIGGGGLATAAEIDLCPLGDEDREFLKARLQHLPLSELQLHHVKSVILLNAPDNPFLFQPLWMNLVRATQLALSLYYLNISIPFAVRVGGNGYSLLSGGDPVPVSPTDDGIPDYEDGKHLGVASIFRAVATRGSDMLIALARLTSAASKAGYSDTFLDYMIGLESLLARDSNQELAFTVASRGAILLGGGLDERTALFQELKDLYDLRSRLAHGNTSGAKILKRMSMRDAAHLAHSYLSRVIVKCIDSPSLLSAEGLRALSLMGVPPGS